MADNTLRVVTLDDLKKQMKIDFEEDDELIQVYGMAAEDAIINATRRTYEELVDENRKRRNNEAVGFPKMLHAAVLMLAAQLYKNREPVSGLSQSIVPYTLDSMIKPWIKLAG